ncbi:mannose-P-dolichol utilization defect 1 protein-like [Phasianus colchicus]|uniref:mannose-P-dolichol utilization defect 1 protein-like n=1 Tax=Phasianus colchicus TaxID=9054 RepID=UPI00129E85F3|nr:mannose-P-dolichol utilization defect 1 protein-like [Phasianus colchicus]
MGRYGSLWGAVGRSGAAPPQPRPQLLQAAANRRQRHTGQLSALSTALTLGGACARIFTSVQDTGDALLILTYVASAACNALLMGQILYYGRAVGRPHSKAD